MKIEDYYQYNKTKRCENCKHCEMYNNEDALCSYKEKWVNHTWAIYCEFYVCDGGSYE